MKKFITVFESNQELKKHKQLKENILATQNFIINKAFIVGLFLYQLLLIWFPEILKDYWIINKKTVLKERTVFYRINLSRPEITQLSFTKRYSINDFLVLKIPYGFQCFIDLFITYGCGHKPGLIATWWQINPLIQQLMEKVIE